MKKVVLTIVLSFAIAVPMASTQTAQSDPWYSVNSNGAKLWQHSFGRGSVRCEIDPGATVNRHWGENWKRWIYVRVTTYPNNWNCRGWVDKWHLSPHVDVQQAWFSASPPNRNGHRVGLELRTKPGGGGLKTLLPHGARLHRNNRASANNDTWIYVQWDERDGNYINHNGNKTEEYRRHGWVLKKHLTPLN